MLPLEIIKQKKENNNNKNINNKYDDDDNRTGFPSNTVLIASRFFIELKIITLTTI